MRLVDLTHLCSSLSPAPDTRTGDQLHCFGVRIYIYTHVCPDDRPLIGDSLGQRSNLFDSLQSPGRAHFAKLPYNILNANKNTHCCKFATPCPNHFDQVSVSYAVL